MLFNPIGSLDVATDGADLPDGGFTRCKNIELTRTGLVTVRKGSAKLHQTAIDVVNHINVQAGVRYEFSDNIYKDESSIASSLTDAQWSSVSYNAFNETTKKVYALNGTDRKKIDGSTVVDWGLDAPTAAPTASETDGSGLSGAFSIKYTYAIKTNGAIVNESNPSPKSLDVTLTDGSLKAEITWPNVTSVTHVRVYRTLAGGLIWYLEDDYPVSVRTTETEVYTHAWESAQGYTTSTQNWTDTDSNSREYTHEWETDFTEETSSTVSFMKSMFTWEGVRYVTDLSDVTLGTEVSIDNSSPPLGTFIAGPNYGGLLFIIKDNLLYYSKSKQPDHWPATYFIEVSTPQFPGVAMVFYNGQPYFLTKRHIYYIQGTGHNTFQPLDMRARTGAQGPQGALTVDGHGIYHIGEDGIYLFAGGNDRKITQNNLDPIFQGADINGVPGAYNLQTAWLISYKNKIYCGYAGQGESYPKNVIVMNLDDPRRVSYYAYPYQMRAVAIDQLNNTLICSCSDGFVRQLEVGTTDDGSGVSWELQSKDYTLQTRRHFPRWVKYDISVSGTATGQLILDDAIHQSHTLSGSRDIKRRLVTHGNGGRCAIRFSGSGQSTIYAAEFE